MTHSAPPIAKAMVLAAGLGARMRPITDHTPKPLVVVGGRTMLDHSLDRLAEAGIDEAVVNVHYLADQIEEHVASRRLPRIVVSDERDALLETGGGIKRALPLLGNDPFFVMNSDSLWLEGPSSNLATMAAAWDPQNMDMLLLLAAAAGSLGYEGHGDFLMDPAGRLARRPERTLAPFVYAGVAILRPELFADTPERAFSLNLLFDRAIEAGRLYGLRLDGQWLHVGTPQAIAEADERIAQSVRGAQRESHA
ncbi:MAG: nucleotidyltransferase family protein [Salinarimonadaceae bacterium]|nr:MAG: nucleotidyltransferase family protein [Salinarimonadaceae bacterium]